MQVQAPTLVLDQQQQQQQQMLCFGNFLNSMNSMYQKFQCNQPALNLSFPQLGQGQPSGLVVCRCKLALGSSLRRTTLLSLVLWLCRTVCRTLLSLVSSLCRTVCRTTLLSLVSSLCRTCSSQLVAQVWPKVLPLQVFSFLPRTFLLSRLRPRSRSKLRSSRRTTKACKLSKNRLSGSYRRKQKRRRKPKHRPRVKQKRRRKPKQRRKAKAQAKCKAVAKAKSKASSSKLGCLKCRGISCEVCTKPGFKGLRLTREEWLERAQQMGLK